MGCRRLVIHTDPAEALPPADIILLTGAGRCSRADILRVSKPQTVVAGPACSLVGLPLNQLVLRPGETRTILGASVSAVAAPDGLRYEVREP